jgi:chorismate mutase
VSQADPQHARRTELHRRREELAEQVAELRWNLGGLAYEMAIRDHFRLDVLLRRAATLQERDAELAEVDRLLHMQESSIVGSCASCGAVRSRGAVYCWQCGSQVMERSAIADETDAVNAAALDAMTAGAHGTELGRPVETGT